MPIKIILDAMGGDHAPQEIIHGAVRALRHNDDLDLIIVGEEEIIRRLLENYHCKREVEIVHASQRIEMHETPKEAITHKPNASINVAMELLSKDRGEALVSAGNTGATVLSAAQFLTMIPGIERSALAAIYPTARLHSENPGFSLMIDVGATLHCSAKHLVHFAYMGSYYAGHIFGISKPRVALLNIGEEKGKGGEMLVQAYEYLQEAPDIHFIGNIEGTEIPKGTAEVIVCEGFVGNVVLKTLEGVSEVLKIAGKYAFRKRFSWKVGLALLHSGMRQLKKRTDYSEYGGAPILGFQKLVIKAHGRSKAKAISNALQVAYRSVKEEVCQHIERSIQKFNEQHRIDFIDI